MADDAPYQSQRSTLAPPSTNPNLGFQPRGGPHYQQQGSLGSDVPAPVVAEEPVDDLLDEEDEEQDTFGCGCCLYVHRLLHKISGGSTCGWMLIGLWGVSLYCVIASTVAVEFPPYITYGVFLGFSLAILTITFLLRFFVNQLVAGLFFPESRVVSFLKDASDPELWILIWASAQLTFWNSTMTLVPDDGPDGWILSFVPETWPFQVVPDLYATVSRMALVVILLWAIRDMFNKLIMTKLLLGFLMNFNDEVITFLHKYALLRRLNAAWIRLIPSGLSEVRDPSGATLFAAGSHQLSNVQAALQAQMSMARTAALLRREGSKMQLTEAVRLREDSKLRFKDSKDPSKLSLMRGGSKLKGSLLKPDEEMAERVSVRVEQPLEDNGPARRTLPDITPARKRQREREFHVETTGRALPRLLEKANISGITKSKLLNMVSVLWIRKYPVVLFVDGQRTELTSKQIARQVGTSLFESLLTFRLSVAAFEEEMQAEEEAARDTSNATRMLQAQRGLKISPTTGDGRDLGGRVDWADMRDGSNEGSQNAEAGVKLVETEAPPIPIAPQPLFGAEDLHAATKDERSSEDSNHEAATPQKQEGGQARRSPAPPSSNVESNEAKHKWFRRRRQSQSQNLVSFTGAINQESRKAPQSVRSGGLGSNYLSSRSTGNLQSPLLQRPDNKVLNEAALAAITAAEIKKVKLLMPDDKDCLTQDFFELFMSPMDAKDLMELLDPGKLGKITSKMFLRGVVNLYRLRKQMVNSLEAQEEIENAFRRVCSYLATFLCLLAFLILLGINANTIIVSGAAVLTAVSLILSFLYTDFIQSIILIVFLNPYRIGDRVRIDGEAQYVRRITTYFTEFESLHGRVQYISHKELSNKLLINESRCKVASTEIAVHFSEKTTPSQYNALKKVLDAYLKSRPLEWIGDSLFVFIQGIGPSQYIEVCIWATHTESWGNWMAVRTQESSFFHFIMRQATVLGMYYRLPIQRWEPCLSSSSALVPSTYGGVSTPQPRSQPLSSDARHPVFDSMPIHSRALGMDEPPAEIEGCAPATEPWYEPPWDYDTDLLALDGEDEWKIERLEDLREELAESATTRYRGRSK